MGQNVFHHVNRAPIRTKHVQTTLLFEINTFKKFCWKECRLIMCPWEAGAMNWRRRPLWEPWEGGRWEVGGPPSMGGGREVHRAGAPSMAETSLHPLSLPRRCQELLLLAHLLTNCSCKFDPGVFLSCLLTWPPVEDTHIYSYPTSALSQNNFGKKNRHTLWHSSYHSWLMLFFLLHICSIPSRTILSKYNVSN